MKVDFLSITMKLFTSLSMEVVFNNSDSTTTSQLLGEVPANPNFTTSGNAANIILAQVTSGTEISLLLGAFEVVGAAAAVIIANPNGIEL